MKESVALAKEVDAKKDFSPTSKSIHRVLNEPERQLGSLRSVIEYIRSDGGTPSAESIATELSSMHTAQRAPVLLALQQTHGNRYVQRVVAGIQAKLKVGQPNDKYEQEADRVAEEVVRMPEPQAVPGGESHIQRACPTCEEEELRRQPIKEEDDEEKLQRQLIEEEEEEELRRQPIEEEEEEFQAKATSDYISEVTPNLESYIQSLKGDGQPLPDSSRDYFEPRFGHDFSQVRLHTDTRAAESARAVNARAFTVGQDVVFGAGEYAPGTSSGKELIAHELTHVVQNDSRIAGIHLFSKEGESKTTEVDKRKEIAWIKFETKLKKDFKGILHKSSINLRMAYVKLIRELMSLVQKEKQAEFSANALKSSILTVIPHVGSILSAMFKKFRDRLSSGKWKSIKQWINSIKDENPMNYLEKKFVEIEKTQFLGDPRFKAFFEKVYADFPWSKEATDPLSVEKDFAKFENDIETNKELDEINNSYITPEKDWKQKLNESIGSSIRENVYLTRVEKERPWLEEKFTLPSKLTPKIIKEKLDQALSVQTMEILPGGGLNRRRTGPECKYIEGAVKAVYNHIVAQVSPSVWRLEENLKAGNLNIAPWELPWEALDNYKEFDGACVHIYFSLERSKVSQDTLKRILSNHMEAVKKLFTIRDLIRTWYKRRREQDIREYKKCLQDSPPGHPWRVKCSKFHLTRSLWGEWHNKAIEHLVYK